MPYVTTITPTPSSGSNVSANGGVSFLCQAQDTTNHHPIEFLEDGSGPGAIVVLASINGGAFFQIYDSIAGFTSGWAGSDTATHAIGDPASGTVAVHRIAAFSNGDGVRYQLQTAARDNTTFSRFYLTSSIFSYTVLIRLITGAVTAAEQTAMAGDYPMLVGNNLLEQSAVAPIWAAGVTDWASSPADVTDPLLPTRYAYDRQNIAQTGPVFSAGHGGFTFLMQMTYSALTDGLHSMDTIGIFNHNFFSVGTAVAVSVDLSDSNDFSGAAQPIHLLAVTSNSRIVVTNLAGTFARYTGVTYARLIVSVGSGTVTAAPYFGELVFGRRRQLSYFPDVPFEDKGSESNVIDHVARSGTRSRYVRSQGQRVLDWTFRSAGADKHGLNQENEVRSWWRECNFGTQPSIVVQRPTSSPMPLYMFPDKASLDMKIYGPYERAFHMPMTEQPVYWQTEQAVLNAYPV